VAKYTLDIDVNYKSVEDLKGELQALEAEFSTLSIGSKGFTELGNKIKGIKSQLKDVELQFEGLDKEQRATALVDTFNGLTGAVGAVSSAFIAFGAESAAIEDAEKKLLGVIGVVTGLRDVSNGLLAASKLFGPAFTNVGAAIQAGFTAGATGAQTFKAALISTGIGAFIVAVGLLVANFDKLFGSAEAAKEAIEGINASLEDQLSLINDINRRQANDAKIQEALLKSQGASEQELSELRRKNYIRDRDAAIESVGKINAAQDAALAKFKGNEEDKQKLIDGFDTKRNAAIVARNNAETALEVERLANIEKANNKAEEKRKERDQKRKERAKNEVEAQQSLNESLRKLDEAQATEGLDAITTQYANELARIQEAQAEELKQENLTAEAKKDIRARFAADAQANEIARQKAVDEFTKAKDEKDKEDEKKKAEELAALRTQIADAEVITEDQRRAREKEKLVQFYDDLIAEATKNGIDVTALNAAKNAALIKQNEEFVQTDVDKQKAYRQQLTDLALNSAVSLINDLKSLNQNFDKDNKDAAKKAFDREQALAAVSTIIETYLSASKAYASQLIPGDPTSPFRATIAASVAVASGLARLAIIKSQKFDGDTGSGTTGGGAGGNIPTSLGTFAPAGTPTIPQTGNTGTGGGAQTGTGGPGTGERVVKTYVLAGDVTSAQQAEALINQKRKF
jgi:hypothetical protein